MSLGSQHDRGSPAIGNWLRFAFLRFPLYGCECRDEAAISYGADRKAKGHDVGVTGTAAFIWIRIGYSPYRIFRSKYHLGGP
jgi:hypothetical protein